MYGLTNQLRRASVAIPSNIAEGQGRRTIKEFLNHLSVARGSVLEVQTQVEIANRLHYLNEDQAKEINNQVTTVVRLVNGLIKALNCKLDPGFHPSSTVHRSLSTSFH
jgi:four helix bundle protein